MERFGFVAEWHAWVRGLLWKTLSALVATRTRGSIRLCGRKLDHGGAACYPDGLETERVHSSLELSRNTHVQTSDDMLHALGIMSLIGRPHRTARTQSPFPPPVPSLDYQRCHCNILLYTRYSARRPNPPSQHRLRLNLLPPPLPRLPLLLLRHHPPPHRTGIQLLPHPIRQRQNARTDRGAIAAIFPKHPSARTTLLAAEVKGCVGEGKGFDRPFSSGLGDRLGEIPELAGGKDLTCCGVSVGGPVRGELDG